jgi:hypothetical protein
LSAINNIIGRKNSNDGKQSLVSSTSMSLQATLTAEAHVAEGQFLFVCQILNRENLIYKNHDKNNDSISVFAATIDL